MTIEEIKNKLNENIQSSDGDMYYTDNWGEAIAFEQLLDNMSIQFEYNEVDNYAYFTVESYK